MGDLNLHVFNMVTGKIVSRTSAKHISIKCECKFSSKKFNSNQKLNNNKYSVSVKTQNNIVCERTRLFLKSRKF